MLNIFCKKSCGSQLLAHGKPTTYTKCIPSSFDRVTRARTGGGSCVCELSMGSGGKQKNKGDKHCWYTSVGKKYTRGEEGTDQTQARAHPRKIEGQQNRGHNFQLFQTEHLPNRGAFFSVSPHIRALPRVEKPPYNKLLTHAPTHFSYEKEGANGIRNRKT